MKKVYQFTIKGQVQGVGFRYTVREFARSKKFIGTIKNETDGTVVAMLWGSKEEMQTFKTFLENNPGWSHVDTVSVHAITDEKTANEFQKLDRFEIIR